MSRNPPNANQSNARLLLWASHALLAIAVACALWAVYLMFQPIKPDCSSPASGCSIWDASSQRSEDFQIEKIGGKAAVFTAHFNDWLASWLQGWHLALLLAAAAGLSAWALNASAKTMAERSLDTPDQH